MALKEHGLPGYGVEARIERGEGRWGAEYVVPVMDHAMGMPVGLREKRCFCLFLVVLPRVSLL